MREWEVSREGTKVNTGELTIRLLPDTWLGSPGDLWNTAHDAEGRGAGPSPRRPEGGGSLRALCAGGSGRALPLP